MSGRRIRISAGSIEAVAELNDTDTADSIWKALPIGGVVQTWGDEVYFAISLTLVPENAQEVVEVGELGYWPPGKAFCIFFGPTPVSTGTEVRPASPVNVFGRLTGDATVFREVDSGTAIVVERADHS